MPFVCGTNTHNKSKMADGRHLGKIEKSPPRPHFDGLRPNLAWRRSSTVFSRPTVKNFKNLKPKTAAAGIMKSRNIAISLRRLKFGTLTQFDPVDHYVSKIGDCTFWLHARGLCAWCLVFIFRNIRCIQNDKRAYLNLAIKQQIYNKKASIRWQDSAPLISGGT